MKTEKEILAMKKEATEIRDKAIQAKATYSEVVKNIDNYKEELKELKVDPENADEAIAKMEAEVDELYEKNKAKLDEWKA